MAIGWEHGGYDRAATLALEVVEELKGQAALGNRIYQPWFRC